MRQVCGSGTRPGGNKEESEVISTHGQGIGDLRRYREKAWPVLLSG